MNERVITGLLGLCAVVLGCLLLRLLMSPARAQSLPQREVGRYSLITGSGAEYFLDTRTGQIWTYSGLEVGKDGMLQTVKPHWVAMDSPVSGPAR